LGFWVSPAGSPPGHRSGGSSARDRVDSEVEMTWAAGLHHYAELRSGAEPRSHDEPPNGRDMSVHAQKQPSASRVLHDDDKLHWVSRCSNPHNSSGCDRIDRRPWGRLEIDAGVPGTPVRSRSWCRSQRLSTSCFGPEGSASPMAMRACMSSRNRSLRVRHTTRPQPARSSPRYCFSLTSRAWYASSSSTSYAECLARPRGTHRLARHG
jgi:hypothetical protein